MDTYISNLKIDKSVGNGEKYNFVAFSTINMFLIDIHLVRGYTIINTWSFNCPAIKHFLYFLKSFFHHFFLEHFFPISFWVIIHFFFGT